jgi:IclR family transcriptional regulator, KDG regulon repressor
MFILLNIVQHYRLDVSAARSRATSAMPASPKSRYRIPMLERSLRVLELLARAPEGLSIAELSRQLSAPKSSVFNILATLEQTGYIRSSNGAGKYVLTTKLYRVGSATLARFSLRQVLHPLLVELVARTSETANLGILDGAEAIYVDSIEGPERVRVAVTTGERLELHCTALGKALAAHLPPERLAPLLKSRRLAARTPHTLKTTRALLAQLEQIRRQGYALDDEEDHLDIRCLGAPVRDDTGSVVAAVSMTAPKHRLLDEAIPEKAGLVMNVAARMSHALGYAERS